MTSRLAPRINQERAPAVNHSHCGSPGNGSQRVRHSEGVIVKINSEKSARSFRNSSFNHGPRHLVPWAPRAKSPRGDELLLLSAKGDTMFSKLKSGPSSRARWYLGGNKITDTSHGHPDRFVAQSRSNVRGPRGACRHVGLGHRRQRPPGEPCQCWCRDQR